MSRTVTIKSLPEASAAIKEMQGAGLWLGRGLLCRQSGARYAAVKWVNIKGDWCKVPT